MNQRIQKLIEQATQSAMWPGDPDAGDLDAEKFAELIVRECARQCHSDDCIRILNHFGVKYE